MTSREGFQRKSKKHGLLHNRIRTRLPVHHGYCQNPLLRYITFFKKGKYIAENIPCAEV